MLDFLGSIVNIIGENINKLIDIVFGQKKDTKEAKPVAPQRPTKEGKPPPWTRKKK